MNTENLLMSKQQLVNIANKILGESDAEINKILKTKILYVEFTQKEPELTYVGGCNCMGNYCDTPYLHGFRLDGFTIKEINERYKK